MDLIQSNGQPRFGRFSEVPTRINIDAYEYKTPYGDVVEGLRKRLRYKKFKFCSIHSDQYSIGVAIVDVAWAGYSFFYVYDHKKNEVMDWAAIHPFATKTQLDEQPLSNQSYFYHAPYQIDMQHANDVRFITVAKYGEIILSARFFCAGTEALSLCSPNGINGWTYTQKLTTLACEGFFTNKDGESIPFHEKTLASLDDTCGFLRPETAWFWLSCNFLDSQNRRVGINLASGVNESFGNENCLWIKGVLYPLTDVLFHQENENSWVIHSLDGCLDLQVTTSWRRYERLNLRLVGSQFSQWQTVVSGYIQLKDKEIILNEEYAILEQHYVKW